MKNYFGRKIAIDASMCIYQFLIAVRQEGNMLVNEDGETTSHLMGLFYRTIRMVDSGIKPVYVFDGKPPEMKSDELVKRQERRKEAEAELAKATEEENQENVEKFSKRLVKVTKQHVEDCKELLRLMGIPFIEAPGEAEAQCAAMVRNGSVFATGTEDMDALTFGCSVLVRHLTVSEARKLPIREFRLDRVLSEMEFSMEQFVDLCILLGCDYCETIRGVGPKRAVELIRKHKDIETILKFLDKKYAAPENWLFKEARQLFLKPDVTDCTEELKWSEPDEDALVAFMCEKNGFNEDRIRNGAKKLTKARSSVTQGRIDTFFKVIPGQAQKRKSLDTKGPASKKGKAKAGAFKRK